tara:strand:- start:57 stop:458 length:402 start_codon:yes stop_codon:yes gene_type:complete
MIDFTPPNKILIHPSVRGGMGVFCKEKILKEEIIEICYLYDLKIKMNEGHINTDHWDYRFIFPKDNPKTHVIPWGYGCLYNHSDTPNADWKDYPNEFAFIFFAIKDIEPGEEICTYYGGDDYWKQRSYTNKIS